MKMIMAIVQDIDAQALLGSLMEQDFGATVVATTGGLLSAGNATILIGTDRVQEALEIISDKCHTRTQLANPIPSPMAHSLLCTPCTLHPVEVQIGGAITFVLEVQRFERF